MRKRARSHPGTRSKAKQRSAAASTVSYAPPSWLTTDDVVRASGVSAVTLRSWAKRDLITKPYIRTDPAGRGRRAYWHPHTPADVEKLRAITGRGVPLELVKARMQQTAYEGSSMSSGRAHKTAMEWYDSGTGGELASVLGLPADASRAMVVEACLAKLAAVAGFREEAIEKIKSAGWSGLKTALFHCIHGVPSVVAWLGAGPAFVAPKYTLDQFHTSSPEILAALIKPEFGLLEGRALFEIPIGDAMWLMERGRKTLHNVGAGEVVVSVEITWLIRALWMHYNEGPLRDITMQKGQTIVERSAGADVEYDYQLGGSGFSDYGLVLEVEPMSARPRNGKNRG